MSEYLDPHRPGAVKMRESSVVTQPTARIDPRNTKKCRNLLKARRMSKVPQRRIRIVHVELSAWIAAHRRRQPPGPDCCQPTQERRVCPIYPLPCIRHSDDQQDQHHQPGRPQPVLSRRLQLTRQRWRFPRWAAPPAGSGYTRLVQAGLIGYVSDRGSVVGQDL